MSERQPDDYDALSAVTGAMLAEVNTCMPGVVVKWNASRPQVCDVRPVIQRVYLDDDGSEMMMDQPVITDAPVAWPQGGGFVLTFPLAAGDPVMLVFSQRSIDRWSASDGKEPHDSGDNRRFNLSDAIVCPGLSTQAATSAHASDVVLGRSDGTVELHITPGGEVQAKCSAFRIGSLTADRALALATETKTALDAIQGKYDGHGHTYVTPGGPAQTTAPSGPTDIIGSIGAIASAKAFTNG